MRPTHVDGIHFLLLVLIGAAGPVIGVLIGLRIRQWRREMASLIGLPLEALLAAVSVAIPVFVFSVRPAYPVILGASVAGVAGEALLLLLSLTRPAWQEPTGFPVIGPANDRTRFDPKPPTPVE
jgi:hypothetical protein